MIEDETPEQRRERLALERATAAVGKVIGAAVHDAAGPGVGFALLMFDFGERGNIAYMSNARRSDMVKTLREFLGKLEIDEAASGVAFRKPGMQ